MGIVHEGSAGDDALTETTQRGDTLIGYAGNDTYQFYIGTYQVRPDLGPGLPALYDTFHTKVIEQAGGGRDMVELHVGKLVAGVGAEELANIEVVRVGDGVGNLSIALDGGNTALHGSARAETMLGGGGNDTLSGAGANDRLEGGDGNDSLDGGAGNDLLLGGAGNDRFVVYAEIAVGGTAGNAGSPGATANGETASLEGRAISADLMDGGDGADTMAAGAQANAIVLDVGGPLPTFWDIEVIRAGAGNDLVDLTSPTYAYESAALLGEGGSDVLWGNQGNDTLDGGAGADRLSGGSGADRLAGGAGKDMLRGDSGADLFVFNTALGTAGVDRIADFNVAEDQLSLDDDVFARLAGGAPLGSANFRAGAAAADGDDYIVYDRAAGALYYDADGSGGGAAVQFATLTGKPALTAAHFAVAT